MIFKYHAGPLWRGAMGQGGSRVPSNNTQKSETGTPLCLCGDFLPAPAGIVQHIGL